MSVDLITLDRARQNLPSAKNTDEPFIATLITSASRAIERYCRREFVSESYDELYDGNGQRRLILRRMPLQSVQSVRYRPVTVLKITNNLAGTPIARVTVTATGLKLMRQTLAVSYTDTSVTWIANSTILAVQNAINTLGNGWSAQDSGYDDWPAADLYCPNGLSGSDSTLPDAQGALTAAGQNAELKLHTYELAGYQVDQRCGWLLRCIPYTDPEMLHPEDLIWPVGINNFRVQYTAGFATVPEDVQQACAMLVAIWFLNAGRDVSLHSETAHGAYTLQRSSQEQIPAPVKTLLDPYRLRNLGLAQG